MTDKSTSTRPISRLYSRYLTTQEKQALRAVPVDNVSSEINLLRVLTALFLKIQQSAPPDLAAHMQALRTYSMLVEQLALLVRSHGELHSPWAELDDAIERAIAADAHNWEKA